MNAQSIIALEPGYELHWYRIERVLGQGAFGITYLAHDINLDRQVAIKEYLPGQFSTRDKDATVKPTSPNQKEDFEWGLKRFISEARTLTKFEHPNLVRVFNVFEMNNTAYMVMNYEVGKSLQQVLKTRKTLSEAEIRKILFPLMRGLELMHAKGFVHRDIKPGNIFLRSDSSPVLLDFGSARQTRAPQGREGGSGGDDTTTTLTTLVSPGYAPIEQYGSKSDRQGPWTDIYGLGATIYRAVSGTTPVAAVDRGEAIVHDMKDPYLSLSAAYQDKYSKSFLAAIDHALAFKAQDRPQSIGAWEKEFGQHEKEPDITPLNVVQIDSSEVITEKLDPSGTETLNPPTEGTEETEKIDSEAETYTPTVKETPVRSSGKRRILVVGVITVFILAGAYMFMGNDEETVIETAMPEIETPVPEQDKILTAEETIPEETPMVEETTAMDDADQAKIQELLRLAQEDIDALRLTSPKDNNAFDKYLTVIQIDENNAEAKTGIQSISDKYVSLAYGAMNSNNLDNAESYLRKASAITPDSDKIAKAQDALQTKRAEQKSAGGTKQEPVETPQTAEAQPDEEPNDSFWGKVKKWNEEQEELSKQNPPKENKLDTRVKKAFGGQ